MKKFSKTLTFLLFLAGVLLGSTLSLLSAWADLEANFYGFLKQADKPFYGLSCPIMMTAEESAHVTIKISNPTNKPISPNVKVDISSPLTYVETFDIVKLAPGESTTLTKSIGAENIDLGQFIFANALVYSAYPLPNRENMCGVFILPMRGNGTALLIIGTILSLLMTGSGAYLLSKSGLSGRRLALILFIAALVPLTMFFSYPGFWLVTVILLAVMLLALVIALGSFITQ